MLFQESVYYPDFEPLITIFIMIFMIAVNLFVYRKIRIWYVMMAIYVYSIYVWFASLSIVDMPLFPVFQNFFLLIQTLIFIARTYQVSKKKRKN